MKSSRIYVDGLGWKNKSARVAWHIVRAVVYRTTPNSGFNWWRIVLLRFFGAKIGIGCKIAPSCVIWAPWNLEMGDFVCVAAGVDLYNVGKICLGSYSTVSQRAFLCSASHDISSLVRPLTIAGISIGEHAWVCAEVFVAPGVAIGSGGVAGARAVVFKNIDPWTVVAGNPAKFVKNREIAK